MKRLLAVTALFLFVQGSVNAARYWPPVLEKWGMHLNNGVAYITSPQIPDHCSYSRAQINMDGTEFNKALYAYALSVKARNKQISYVIDSSSSVCVVSGLSEQKTEMVSD